MEKENRKMTRCSEPFSNCKKCGNRILWLRTPAGKNMPVDPNLINYREVPGGKERIVTPNGMVIAGERSNPDEADGVGYISHFATCGK